jgi:hypothetical protein
MINKDKAEIDSWTDDLEYMNEELEYLLDIEDKMVRSRELYQQMQYLRRENQLKLSELYRYGSTMRNAIECDTVECDAFYLHKHEKNRTIYLTHVQKYRDVKRKMLSKLLLHAQG